MSSNVTPMSVSGRRAWHVLTAIAVVAALALAQGDGAQVPGGADRAGRPAETAPVPVVEPRRPDRDLTIVAESSPGARAVAVSRALYTRSDVAVLAAPGASSTALAEARQRGVPVLVEGAPETPAELQRLGAEDVVTAGADPAVLARALEDRLGTGRESGPESGAGADVVLLTRDGAADAAVVAAAGSAEVVEVPGGDVRTDSMAAARLRALGGRPTLVLGGGWTDPGYTLGVVRSAPELPGGGHTLFPGRHVVALYGSPGAPALGLLGEQDATAAAARARDLAAQYAPISDRPVVGAFEIIVTIADADPGPDGDYSRDVPLETVRPWVDAAREAGLLVILDLQPGRSDFLTQARRYEELLREPHVGLALDPEWRLAPDQVHLRQIGAVDGAEVDAVAAWLASLTREEGLPQKLFVLHQFTPSMIGRRELVRTDRPELQVVVHVDGHGQPGAKLETWNRIRAGAAPQIAWGWKNFVDEDQPMLTPEQTWGVQPRPDLVTYQ